MNHCPIGAGDPQPSAALLSWYFHLYSFYTVTPLLPTMSRRRKCEQAPQVQSVLVGLNRKFEGPKEGGDDRDMDRYLSADLSGHGALAGQSGRAHREHSGSVARRCGHRIKLELGAHTGTHMDAPKHFLADGAGLDDMPLDASIGPARVISIAHPQVILPAELEAHRLQAGERVLFHTRNSERCWKNDQFVEDFVYISAAAAQFLVQRQVRTVGIDYLSVGGYVHDAVETHRILLGAGIWLIEGLNLSAVKPGAYELVCLPLRVAGADGAPARAILRPRGQ